MLWLLGMFAHDQLLKLHIGSGFYVQCEQLKS